MDSLKSQVAWDLLCIVCSLPSYKSNNNMHVNDIPKLIIQLGKGMYWTIALVPHPVEIQVTGASPCASHCLSCRVQLSNRP